MQSAADRAARCIKDAVSHGACIPTARRRRPRRILDASASRTTWPSIGSTATERRAPATAQRCPRPASSWTAIRDRTDTIPVTAAVNHSRRTATGPHRRRRRTRLPAGRPLAAGPRRPIASGRRDTLPLTATRRDITTSPTTCRHQRDSIPIRPAAHGSSWRRSAGICTSTTATTTAANGRRMVPSTQQLAITRGVSDSWRLTRAGCCRVGRLQYTTRCALTVPTTIIYRSVEFIVNTLRH